MQNFHPGKNVKNRNKTNKQTSTTKQKLPGLCDILGGACGPVVNTSNSGSGGPEFKPHPLRYFLLDSTLSLFTQGPVVQRPITANPGLKFNPGLFLFLSKAFSRTIFSLLFRGANHQIVDKKN